MSGEKLRIAATFTPDADKKQLEEYCKKLYKMLIDNGDIIVIDGNDCV